MNVDELEDVVMEADVRVVRIFNDAFVEPIETEEYYRFLLIWCSRTGRRLGMPRVLMA